MDLGQSLTRTTKTATDTFRNKESPKTRIFLKAGKWSGQTGWKKKKDKK